MKTQNCFIMKTPNYLDNCLQLCSLVKVIIGLLWNVLWVVHILSIAHRLELMQAMMILLDVNKQQSSIERGGTKTFSNVWEFL